MREGQLAGQSPLTLFMNITDGYHSKKVVTFDTQDRLDDKIDKLMSMISKLIAHSNNQNKHFKYKFFKVKGEEKQGITKMKAIIGIDINQIVLIGECPLGVELGMDRIIEEGHNMFII